MAKPGEMFEVDQMVTWHQDEIMKSPEAMAALVGDITEFGPGPFRVVAAHQAEGNARDMHPQTVVICTNEAHKSEFFTSGKWLTRITN